MEYKEEKTPNQNIEKKKESKKSETSVRSLWDNFKRTNIHIMPEGEEREQKIENLFKK